MQFWYLRNYEDELRTQEEQFSNPVSASLCWATSGKLLVLSSLQSPHAHDGNTQVWGRIDGLVVVPEDLSLDLALTHFW